MIFNIHVAFVVFYNRPVWPVLPNAAVGFIMSGEVQPLIKWKWHSINSPSDTMHHSLTSRKYVI